MSYILSAGKQIGQIPTTSGPILIKETVWDDPYSLVLQLPESMDGVVVLPRSLFSKQFLESLG